MKKISYIPIFTKLFLTNDNKKNNSIHRWVCKKDYPRYKSSYMCRKINFMFIPSIIVQNCEGRAARTRQALIMYHPYLHLYPDLVISISTDSPYIKQMTYFHCANCSAVDPPLLWNKTFPAFTLISRVWYNNHIHNSLLVTIMKYFWKTHQSGRLHFSGYIITSPLYLTTYLFSLLAIINLISLRCVYFKTNQ